MGRKALFAEFISALLILLFGYTAISKVMGYGRFRHALAESPLIRQGAGVAAWLVILTEVMIVLLLFFPATRLKGLYLSFGVLSIFTIYLMYIVLFAAKLPCGCGGVINALSWKQHILFNFFFLLINGLAVWQEKLAPT